jgi:hypothetical protein
MMKTKKILSAGLLVLLCVGIFGMAFAQEVKEEKGVKKATNVKEIEGEVSAVNKNGIAVVYKRDLTKGTEYEIFLPLDDKVKIAHKRKIDEISVGDIVKVQYDEITEEAREGPRKTLKGVTVTFLKPAPKKPESPVVESDEEETETGALPLKGIK